MTHPEALSWQMSMAIAASIHSALSKPIQLLRSSWPRTLALHGVAFPRIRAKTLHGLYFRLRGRCAEFVVLFFFFAASPLCEALHPAWLSCTLVIPACKHEEVVFFHARTRKGFNVCVGGGKGSKFPTAYPACTRGEGPSRSQS